MYIHTCMSGINSVSHGLTFWSFSLPTKAHGPKSPWLAIRKVDPNPLDRFLCTPLDRGARLGGGGDWAQTQKMEPRGQSQRGPTGDSSTVCALGSMIPQWCAFWVPCCTVEDSCLPVGSSQIPRWYPCRGCLKNGHQHLCDWEFPPRFIW